MISVTSFGAAGTVTGSCHLLKVDKHEYLVDCGAFQGSQELEARNLEEFPFNPKHIENVFLTHAHYDHSGRLLNLVSKGFSGNIYCTSATRDLTSVVLMDSVKIQDTGLTEKDVIATLDHFRSHAYGKCKYINDNINYTAYNAGHILGSSFMSINATQKTSLLAKLFKKKKENINILFTGDIGRKNNPIVNPPAQDFPAPDYIFMEATYGNRLHEDLECSLEDLAGIINETSERGGKIIIPTFAIERAQELIYYLKVLMQKNKIPKLPVYIDSPMATTATGVFQIHPECFNNVIRDRFVSKDKNPFSVQSLHIVKDNQESIRLAKSKKPCIVIAANGMCTAGRILNHLFYGLENYNNTILLVGYASENTLARQLMDGAEYVNLNTKELLVKANVATIGAFSAHADYNEMLDWLSGIDTSKLKGIYLVHGSPESLNAMQDLLISRGYPRVNIVQEGIEYKLN